MPELRITDGRLKIGLLVDGVAQGEAHAWIVEGRMKPVGPQRVLVGVGTTLHVDALLLFEQRQQIVRHGLEGIDFVVLQSIDRGLRVRDRDPLDAIHLRHLAAGEVGGRLGARHVFGVLHIDDAVARPPFVGLEDERPGAGGILQLRRGRQLGHALGHHEGHDAGRLGERVEHQAVGLLQFQADGLRIGRGEVLDVAEELYAHHVAAAPAAERGDAVLGGDRRAVVPGEPLAQPESVDQAGRIDAPLVDHLRLRLQLAVEAEQRVVDQVAVRAADLCRRPDRIEDFQVRVHDDLQRRLRECRSCQQERGEKGEESHGAFPCRQAAARPLMVCNAKARNWPRIMPFQSSAST